MNEHQHTATLTLGVTDPDYVKDVIAPDLQDADRIGFDVTAEDAVHIQVSAETLGVMRGGLNTAMKLTKLATRFEVNDDE
ncbi:MAG: CTAG/PCC1 family protein [Candidatus Nanohaloarchaeota archaeon QJJ-5]|nr:CTAG/PCC1 family protein [Candidatus Nanohaloarchaeota archaeon QJJ-5]